MGSMRDTTLTAHSPFFVGFNLGRALTKTFIHMPFVGTVMPKHHCANKRLSMLKSKFFDHYF